MATPRRARAEQTPATRADDLARAQRSAMALRLAAAIKATSPHAQQAPAAANSEPDPERESEGDSSRAGHKTPTGRRRSTPRRQTPKERTPDRDDGSLSVLSSDASPSESVFEFLSATGLALFTPPPQAHTRSMGSSTAASSPGANGSRQSSAATSPSQFFRSPVRKRKTSTSHSRPPLATPPPATTRLNRTPRRPRSAKRKPVEPLEVYIKDENDLLSASAREAADLLKPGDLSLSPWPRLSTTPGSTSVKSPSPALRQLGVSLTRRLKDAFDEAEALDMGDTRRNSLDATADDLFSAAPSGLHGPLSDHDSFFSFASSLSPLANAEELEASFLSVRLSPMTSFGSYELPRLLPPFPANRSEDGDQEEKAETTPTKPPNSRQSSFGLSSSGKARAALMETSFPNIKASTSATPGKDQRSQIQNHSVTMTRLHSPFETVSLSSTRHFQAINNSLKRKGQGRKRKLEDKRSGSNVQRKLLHTPVKSSPLRTLRSPLHPLNGRMPQRSVNQTPLPSLGEGDDEGRALAMTSSAGCVQQLKLETPVKTPAAQQSKKRRAPGSSDRLESHEGSTPKRTNALQHRQASTSPGLAMTSSVALAGSNSAKHPPTASVLKMQTPIKEEVAEASMSMPSVITSSTKPKKAPCNCKKSKCLKLYCECFASGGYCDESCNCVGCANTPATESERQEAINARLEKNPNAFKPKIEATALSPSSAVASAGSAAFLSPLATQRLLLHHSSGGVKKMHKHGCHCKKSACQKKYCECFQAGVPCGDNCRCIDCKNQAPCVAHASPAVASTAALTPSNVIDETFVSPVLHNVRKRLRIDRETWAKNFSTPYESSPTSLRERTERFRSRLQAATNVSTPSASTASSLSVRLKHIQAPIPPTPVQSTPKRARTSHSSALSPLTDAAPRSTSDAITSSSKSRELTAVHSLTDGLKRSRVFVLPLFGAEHPPLRLSVSAAIFRFLTNADLHNASLVNRLWSQVALGSSVWDHANFIPARRSNTDDQDHAQTSALVPRAASK